MKPVWIRGSGAWSAAGHGVGLLAGACLEAQLTPARLRFKSLGAEVELPYLRAPARDAQAGLRVAEEALGAHLGVSRSPRFGLFVGTSSSGIAGHERAYAEAAARGSDAYPIHSPDQSKAARQLHAALACQGPHYTLSTACSSAANALLYASLALRDGRLDEALVVGIEEENRLSQQGFFSLMLATRDSCRPFDARRDGIVLGECAAALWLSTRQGEARWRVLGGASLCDAVHPTNPDAAKIAATIHAALADAGIGSEAVTAVKAHGTGTRANDQAEALGLRRVFGERVPPFTSLKPAIGHTLGACGALETAAFLACLEAGCVPATRGFAETDPELGIAPLDRPLPWRGGIVLLNYFGFGGNNCSLVVEESPAC